MSTHHAQHAAGHDDHGHGGGDHGSFKSYVTGFLLSVVLTAIPFGLVMSGGLENKLFTVGIVVLCAAIQIVVHVIFFLHMNSSSEEGWTFLSMMFTVIVVVIVLSGSLWVMYHMNTNMMPVHGMESMSDQL